MILNKDLKLDLELEEELKSKGINTNPCIQPCYYDDWFVFILPKNKN